MIKQAIFAGLVLCTVFTAQAQDKEKVERKGLVFGTALGLSHSIQSFPNKNQNDTDFGLDLKFGYMIKPNLAILLTSNVSGYDYSGIGRDRKRDFGILAPSIQFWLNDRFWILGGIGLGLDAPVFFDIENPDTDPEETAYYSGLGLIGSAGYELYQKKKFTIDLKTRVGYRNLQITEGKTQGVSIGLLIGINFH